MAEQLRVAAGEKLRFRQEDITVNGHAIELRLYAEDAARDFAPTTGPILAYRPPPGIRVDSGIAEGGSVTAAFDPMLAKVIVHAQTREAAIAKADKALSDFVLLGCQTNSGFLRRLLQDPDFIEGNIHTGLIAEKTELMAEPLPDDAITRQILAIAALSLVISVGGIRSGKWVTNNFSGALRTEAGSFSTSVPGWICCSRWVAVI